MRKLHILLISQYYDPEPEPFPHQLAKGMVKRGHKVSVITGFPNYPYGRIFPGHKQRLWRWEEIDHVRVLRFPLYPDHSISPIKRSLYYLSLAFSASAMGPLLCGDVHVIFVYHPLSLGIPAWWIGQCRQVPFVINIQDMYPESLSATDILGNRFILNAVNKFTNLLYGRASAVAVISPGFKQNLIRKGVPRDKIDVIFNWADEENYRPVAPQESLGEQWHLKGSFNIIYAGSMGPAQGLQNVLEAAARLDDLPEVKFVMIGDGLEKANLETMARDKHLSNVVFLPRQPVTQMPHFYAWADALLVHLIDAPLFEITLPSKVQSSLASGRPILIAVKGDAADLVTAAEAGLAIQPSDPEALAEAVRKLYSLTPQAREQMGKNGREYFLKNLTSKVIFDKYDEFFKRVAKRN